MLVDPPRNADGPPDKMLTDVLDSDGIELLQNFWSQNDRELLLLESLWLLR